MLRAGSAGEAVVRVEVDAEGRVVRSHVVASSLREFAAPAELAVAQWRFVSFPTPGMSTRLPMILDCRIVFELSDENDGLTLWGPMARF